MFCVRTLRLCLEFVDSILQERSFSSVFLKMIMTFISVVLTVTKLM